MQTYINLISFIRLAFRLDIQWDIRQLLVPNRLSL